MRTATLAAALVAFTALPSLGDSHGVSGEAESPLLTALAACRAKEQQALDLASGAPQDSPLPAETGATVKSLVEEAIACLQALKTSIESGGPYQDSTAPDAALRAIDKAIKSDGLAIKKVEKNKPASKVAHDLDRAGNEKTTAAALLLGMPATSKDAAALKANGTPDGTYVADGDLKADKKFPKEFRNGPSQEAVNARGRAMRRRKPKGGGSYLTTRSAKEAKAPADLYYGFEGTKADEDGYAFVGLDRRLFGPFEVRFKVGVFDPNREGDTGSACVELDMEGSNPLQFLAVCARYVSGGMQVFAQSHQGAAGNEFWSGYRELDIVVNYDGSEFTCRAKPVGAPDFMLDTFATFTWSQGETALLLGFGASGLRKGGEIGLDEIYVTPLLAD